MAIASKPQASPAHERRIEEVINKGGNVAAEHAAKDARVSRATRAQVVLRIPAELLERLDTAVAARPVPIARHSWMLEAIFEKIERESF